MCRRCPEKRRGGAALLEFSLVAFVLIALLAVTIDFGRAVHVAQVVQQAADAGARALARVPLAPTATFEQALQDPTVRAQVYDDSLLSVQLAPGQSVFDYFNQPNMPLVNRLLAPLMIVDQNNIARYPGIMMDPNDPRPVRRYRIPVTLQDAGGSIQLVDVVEEISPNAQVNGPFSLTASGNLQGYVALRINYPFQAAALVAYQPGANAENVPIAVPPQATGGEAGAYGGSDGRGLLFAQGQMVRPFRRLVSGQAIYRREVFGAQQPNN